MSGASKVVTNSKCVWHLLSACAWLLVATCANDGFVKRNGSQLYLDGKPFYFVGANAYWLIASSTDHYKVDKIMSQAKIGVQTKQQQNVLFQWVSDALAASKRSGGPLAGILFWEAGVGGPGAQDHGYSINMRRKLQGRTATVVHRNSSCCNQHLQGATSSSSALLVSSCLGKADKVMLKLPDSSQGLHKSLHNNHCDADCASLHGLQRQSRRLSDNAVGGAPEQLDAFRRFSARKTCAEAAAAVWKPTVPPQAVNVSAYMARVSEKTTVEILREAAFNVT